MEFKNINLSEYLHGSVQSFKKEKKVYCKVTNMLNKQETNPNFGHNQSKQFENKPYFCGKDSADELIKLIQMPSYQNQGSQFHQGKDSLIYSIQQEPSNYHIVNQAQEEDCSNKNTMIELTEPYQIDVLVTSKESYAYNIIKKIAKQCHIWDNLLQIQKYQWLYEQQYHTPKRKQSIRQSQNQNHSKNHVLLKSLFTLTLILLLLLFALFC